MRIRRWLHGPTGPDCGRPKGSAFIEQLWPTKASTTRSDSGSLSPEIDSILSVKSVDQTDMSLDHILDQEFNHWKECPDIPAHAMYLFNKVSFPPFMIGILIQRMAQRSLNQYASKGLPLNFWTSLGRVWANDVRPSGNDVGTDQLLLAGPNASSSLSGDEENGSSRQHQRDFDFNTSDCSSPPEGGFSPPPGAIKRSRGMFSEYSLSPVPPLTEIVEDVGDHSDRGSDVTPCAGESIVRDPKPATAYTLIEIEEIL